MGKIESEFQLISLGSGATQFIFCSLPIFFLTNENYLYYKRVCIVAMFEKIWEPKGLLM